jgi:hypothetical protein
MKGIKRSHARSIIATNFSQQTVAQFLCGKDIPADILNLPQEALSGPQGL